MPITKPMLASPVKSLDSVEFPVYASIKLDGIRALKIKGGLVSRSFKPIPNNFIRKIIESKLPDGIDGELLVGDTFHSSSSAIMSQDGEPDFVYYIFDWVTGDLDESFSDRYLKLKDYFKNNHADSKYFKLLPHEVVYTREQLVDYESNIVKMGHEGVMIRSMDGPYKCGRSSPKEGYLLKIKRFEDSEAVILGFDEQMHNTNEAEQDNFGMTKRSTAKAGLVASGVLGTLTLRDLKTGIEFKCGTGFDAEQRSSYWRDKDQLIGKIIKYRFQPAGVKEAPRFPTFLGFRDLEDF